MTEPTGPTGTQTSSGRRLVRRSDDKMVAGVCSGLAAHLGVDVTLVRVLTVLGAVFGFGSLIVAYLVMWAVVPQE